MGSFKDELGKLGQNAGWIGALIALAGSVINGYSQYKTNKQLMQFNQREADRQREWTEVQTAKQNTWNEQQWEKQNEYNTPEAQKQRLEDAGLNPMYYGIDGIPAAQLTAAQPLGYERAAMGDMKNPISSAIEAALKIKEVDNSTKIARAQIDKMNAETGGLKLDNEFKEKTMQARVDGQKLANDATKEQIGKIKQEVEESKKRVEKLIEETKSEIEKQGLLAAQTALEKAQEKEILELLPQKKLLMEAQTAAQKAAAAASYVHAMYEKGLIESGYIDKMCQHLEAQIKNENASADQKEIQNAVNQWKLSVKNGNVYDIDSIPWSRPTDKIAAYICNELFRFASATSEAVGGGLAGFF